MAWITLAMEIGIHLWIAPITHSGYYPTHAKELVLSQLFSKEGREALIDGASGLLC